MLVRRGFSDIFAMRKKGSKEGIVKGIHLLKYLFVWLHVSVLTCKVQVWSEKQHFCLFLYHHARLASVVFVAGFTVRGSWEKNWQTLCEGARYGDRRKLEPCLHSVPLSAG